MILKSEAESGALLVGWLIFQDQNLSTVVSAFCVIYIWNTMTLTTALSFPFFLTVSIVLASSLLSLDFDLKGCHLFDYSDENVVECFTGVQ